MKLKLFLAKAGVVHRIGLLILTLTVLSIGADHYNLGVQKELIGLSEIHQKIGVVSVESLDADDQTQFGEMLKASVIENEVDTNDYKEILVNYNSTKDNSIYLLKIDSNLTEPKLADIYKESSDFVDVSEPNYEVSLATTTIQPVDLESLSTLKNTNDFLAPGGKVAIIDSGIDTTHTKLKDKIVEYKNLSVDSRTDLDLVGHGTHIAGIIISEAPNTKLYPIKFTDGKLGRLSDLLRSIDYAVTKDVDVINLSLGLKENSTFLSTKIQKALDKDIVVVAAAGNQNTNLKFYPAAQKDVVSVAGLNKNGKKMFSSNYGDWVDFATVGQDIYSTYPVNQYKYWSGTSQAAAKFTGILLDYAARETKGDLQEALTEITEVNLASEEAVTDEYAELLGARILSKNYLR